MQNANFDAGAIEDSDEDEEPPEPDAEEPQEPPHPPRRSTRVSQPKAQYLAFKKQSQSQIQRHQQCMDEYNLSMAKVIARIMSQFNERMKMEQSNMAANMWLHSV